MTGKSVLDLGCGFGDLCGFLMEKVGRVSYTGYDIVGPFVEEARRRYPDARFEVRNVFTQGIHGEFDYILSSGLHNMETGTNDSDMEGLISDAWNAAKIAVAINFLSAYADWSDPHCHRYDPNRMLAAALRNTRNIVLRHDYLPHDFSLFLYRELRLP